MVVFGLRIWMGIGALLLLGVVLGTLGGCGAPPPPPPPPAVEEDPPPPPRPVFTQAQFDALLFGMTYPQVRDALGAEANRQESTFDEGQSEYVQPSVTAWYYWENEDGSFIKLGFVEKKLTDKVSENLPLAAPR